MAEKPPKDLRPPPLPIPTGWGAKAQKSKACASLYRQATIQASVTKVSNVTELWVAPSPTKAQVQSLHFYLSSQELGGCLGTVALSYPSTCSDGFIPSFMETHPEPENHLYFRPPKSWLSGPISYWSTHPGEAHIVP